MGIGLEPFQNIDELLHQFYLNFNSDRLFKMPLAELEGTWDTKILSDERTSPNLLYYQLRDSSDFKNKPYKSERDAFFVEKYVNAATGVSEFSIIISQYYYNEHATLFPEGNFPRLLPRPVKRFELREKQPAESSSEAIPKQAKVSGEYVGSASYYWLDSSQTRAIYFYSENNSATDIRIVDRVPPNFLIK